MALPVKPLQDKNGNAFQPNVPDKVGHLQVNGSSTMIASDTTTTMSEDGWIYVSAFYNDPAVAISDEEYLKINDTSMSLSTYGTTQVSNSFWIPVHKGDVVTWHLGGLFPISRCYFRKVRTQLNGEGV